MEEETGKGADLKKLKLPRVAALMAIAAALGTIGFLAAGSVARSATTANKTISLRSTKLGMILVNSRGRTLYLFAKDRSGKSACTSQCAQYWPPLLSQGKPTAGPGVKAALVGRTTRADGSMQVTYNKHPLYTFALDKQAGQVNGEASSNFGAKWYAVSAAGTAVVKAPATTTPTTGATTNAATTTGGYPYP
jgi:predicted lipoprotein with Yx(FWY)xxD motif